MNKKKEYWDISSFYDDIEMPTVKGITEPPCKYCKYFSPMIAHFIEGRNDGAVSKEFVACTTKVMYRDFCCFRPKEGV